ncbi:MAG: GNAT family N-acetyltransferase [candidate division Zixibacteria bacterium]|nr:GNAT family N-acetyltransferase [candidate division Zixibacteria bacterium]
MNDKFILRKITTSQEFKELKDKWNYLLEQSSQPNVFLTWEWLYTWWEFYSPGYKLFILLISDQEGNLLGIAPLCSALITPLKLKTLKFLGTEEVCSDHLDFILSKGMEKELLSIFFRYLRENPKEWDLLDLTDLSEKSNAIYFIQIWSSENTYLFSVNTWTICPYASLPDNWEAFLKQLSANSRKDIRRQLRLLDESKKINFSIVKNRDMVIPSMEKLFCLHTKRWSTIGEEGVFQRDRFTGFHRKIAQLFFDKGWLLIFELSADKRFIAIYYNFLYSNRIYSYQSGIDSAWDNFSPGTVALSLTIKSAILNGIKEFDFLRGDAPYKYKWTDKNRMNLQLRVWNENLKADFYRNAILYLDKTKKYAKKYLPDFAIKIFRALWRKFGIV